MPRNSIRIKLPPGARRRPVTSVTTKVLNILDAVEDIGSEVTQNILITAHAVLLGAEPDIRDV